MIQAAAACSHDLLARNMYTMKMCMCWFGANTDKMANIDAAALFGVFGVGHCLQPHSTYSAQRRSPVTKWINKESFVGDQKDEGC